MPRNTTQNYYTDSNPSQKNRGQHEMFGRSYWQASRGWSWWRVENLLKGEGAKALVQEGEPWQTWQKWGRMTRRLLSVHVPNSCNYTMTPVERIVPLEESSKQGGIFVSQVSLACPVWKTGVSKDLLEHMNFRANGCRVHSWVYFAWIFECHILVHGTGKDGGVGITMPVVQMLRPGMGSSGGRYTCL